MCDRDSGFALLIVLWSMVLLALLGATITAAGRAETHIAANLIDGANAEAAADGAVAVAAFHLLDRSPGHWDAGSAAPHALTIGEASVSVSARDQSGMIDPNETPPGLLAALLRHEGVDIGTAQNVANAVTDWRSPNDAGLAPVYRSQNRVYAPPHEAFQSLDELSLVAYVTPQVLALLRPHVSLGIEQTPDPAQADPLVLAALQDAAKLNLPSGPAGAADPAGPLIVAITATAHAHGASFTRRATVRLNAAAPQPYQVLDWAEN